VRNELKRVIAFVGIASWVLFLGWLGGIDYSERAAGMAVVVGIATLCGLVGFSYPYQED